MVSGKTGVFFEEQTVQSLVDAVRQFENIEWAFQPSALIAHARQYSKKNFESRMRVALDCAFGDIGSPSLRSSGSIAAPVLDDTDAPSKSKEYVR